MKRILVIDDEESIQHVIKQFLTLKGYQVETAFNGKLGLALHQKNPFDLIVSDMIMPECDGVETIMHLKKKMKSDVKIIGISGGGIGDANLYLRMAKSSGSDYVLRKPFSNDELLHAIETLLGENKTDAQDA